MNLVQKNVWGNSEEPVFYPCWFTHESGFISGDAKDVVKSVQACVKRAGGRNLLCAHPDITENVIETVFTHVLEERISAIETIDEKNRDKMIDEVYTLELATHILDNFVHFIYKKDTTRKIIPQHQYKNEAIEKIQNFEKLKAMYCSMKQQSITEPLDDKTQKEFLALVQKSQTNLQPYWEELIEQVKKYESLK